MDIGVLTATQFFTTLLKLTCIPMGYRGSPWVRAKAPCPAVPTTTGFLAHSCNLLIFNSLLLWKTYWGRAACQRFHLLCVTHLHCYLMATQQHPQKGSLHTCKSIPVLTRDFFTELYGLHFPISSPFYSFYPLHLPSFSSWWSIFWLSSPDLTHNLEPVVMHLPWLSPPHHAQPTLTLLSCTHLPDHFQEHWLYQHFLLKSLTSRSFTAFLLQQMSCQHFSQCNLVVE